MIHITLFPPRSFDTRALLMDYWRDFWEVYILFSVNGVPWETSSIQATKREEEKYPNPHNLCAVAVGDISIFPLWISEFIEKYVSIKLEFGFTETPTYLKLEKTNQETIISYEYSEYYVPKPTHPNFSAKIILSELVEKVLAILPDTEKILTDLGQSEVLQTPFWKRYVKRYFLNLKRSFNPSPSCAT